ncbi:hypothetical protein EZV62_021622 [Acer yangbiense]|uniref:Uncharacterized protein n=1 Tax=Acer yangbiense TaxID=1000413 RepID=A0A5C7H5T2_9ROSI|nr:hypothetical protein EZV62_021622 [Acer yangbiense]
MREVLGLETLVGEKFRQEVKIPWSDEVREIQNDASLMDVLSEFEQRKVNQIHFNVDYIPLSNYNLNQQPNIEQEPIILTDSSSSPFEDDANYNSDGGSYQSTINSDDEVPNDASEDEVPNDISEDEVPNDNDSVDENDGLSDVNEDDIADEEVVDQPIMGTAFRTGNDGRITLEMGQLFRNSTHFRKYY